MLLSKTPEEARALAMLISKEAWDECVQRYGGGPLVSSLEVCQTCKVRMIIWYKLAEWSGARVGRMLSGTHTHAHTADIKLLFSCSQELLSELNERRKLEMDKVHSVSVCKIVLSLWAVKWVWFYKEPLPSLCL